MWILYTKPWAPHYPTESHVLTVATEVGEGGMGGWVGSAVSVKNLK